jgi:hypothetical protein
MGIQLKNNVSSTLAAAISASDVGMTVATGTGAQFPTLGVSDYFYATLETSQGTQEIVKVTVRSGDNMTIVRAQDGSTANSFGIGARIELRINAAVISNLVSPIIANFTGTGSQVNFSLLSAPDSENSTQIYINGVYQQKNTYSVAGSVITFSQAPPFNTTIEVNYV